GRSRRRHSGGLAGLLKGLDGVADTRSSVPREGEIQMAAPRTKRAQEGDSHLAWAGESEVRSVAQLKMLHRLARRLNELNDVGQIAEAITGELRALIDYHNCRVHLISEDGKTLVPIAFRGELSAYQGETFDALVLRVGEGV